MVLNTKFPVPLFRDYVQSLRNIRNIREEWSAKSPLEKWCYIYGIGKISGRMTGLPPFEEEMRVTWYSYAGYAIFATYTALALYTNVYYWLHGDFLRGLPCTCVLIGPWMGVDLNLYCISFNENSIIFFTELSICGSGAFKTRSSFAQFD